MTKLHPTFNNVVVLRDEAGGKTEGGILLPDSAKDKPKRGTVIAVGPGRWDAGKFVETTIKATDRVLFGAFAGSEVEIGKEKVLVMPDSEIIAVLKD